jgi:hypothetical protein
MSRVIEHRRIATPGGVFTPDTDWPGTRALPSFVPSTSIASGGIVPIASTSRGIIFWAELYDGMGDDAEPIAPGTFKWNGRAVSYLKHRGQVIYAKGVEAKNVYGQERAIEDELPSDCLTWLMMTAAADLGTAEAIWIFAAKVRV